jgi:hypothetical protein
LGENASSRTRTRRGGRRGRRRRRREGLRRRRRSWAREGWMAGEGEPERGGSGGFREGRRAGGREGGRDWWVGSAGTEECFWEAAWDGGERGDQYVAEGETVGEGREGAE